MAIVFLTIVIIGSMLIMFSNLPYYTCGIEEKKERMVASEEAKFDVLVYENGHYVSRKIVR